MNLYFQIYKESLKIYNKFIENKDSPRLRRNEYKKFTTAGSGIKLPC